MKLTTRQQQILDWIRQHQEQHGYPPTRAEIAQHFGFKSANAAEAHLRALEKKGAIDIIANASRGIRLNWQVAEETPVSYQAHPQASNDELNGQANDLPVLGRVAAGGPIFSEQHIDQRLQIPPSLFSPAAHYLLRVQGLSMKDAGILEDDMIAVHRTSKARSGDIVIARLDDEVTVKRLQQQGKQILLLPENAELSPIEIKPGQDFVIEGVCVGVIRRH